MGRVPGSWRGQHTRTPASSFSYMKGGDAAGALLSGRAAARPVPMDRLPPELVAAVAALLPLESLRAVRLVDHRLAEVAFPVLARHVSFVNTKDCLEEFAAFLDAKSGAVRHAWHLTIYHGSWPACTRDEWQAHPLLLGGNDRICARGDPAVAQAYRRYRRFIAREQSRGSCDFLRVVRRLANLRSITLSHLRRSHAARQPQYSRLRREIWLEPYFRDSAGPTVTCVLGALNQFPGIRTLEIRGPFNPVDVEGPVNAGFIENLYIASLNCSSRQRLLDFFSRFQRVRQLTVHMADDAAEMPLGQVCLPRIELLQLCNCQFTETSLSLFLDHHDKLSLLQASGMRLSAGSWETLLGRLRARSANGPPAPTIIVASQIRAPVTISVAKLQDAILG